MGSQLLNNCQKMVVSQLVTDCTSLIYIIYTNQLQVSKTICLCAGHPRLAMLIPHGEPRFCHKGTASPKLHKRPRECQQDNDFYATTASWNINGKQPQCNHQQSTHFNFRQSMTIDSWQTTNNHTITNSSHHFYK